MAKTRLTQDHRTALVNFARRIIRAPETHTEMVDAHALALGVMLEVTKGLWPARDMDVLGKYGQANTSSLYIYRGSRCLGKWDSKGTRPTQPDDHVNSTSDLEFPYIFRADFRHPNGRDDILVEGPQGAVLEEFFDAIARHKEAINAKLLNYKTLINAARYFEDLPEAWPDVVAMRDRICKNRPPALPVSVAVMQAVLNDSLARKELGEPDAVALANV